MQLTLRSNHAMRLVMYCALIGDRVAPVQEIARACNMSEAHLGKIANSLAAHGVLRTVRGRCGGVRLARAPEQINVGEIVRVTEIGRCLVECLESEACSCPLIAVCRFRSIVGRALDAFYGVLDGYTVADLIVDQTGMMAALGLPQPQGPDTARPRRQA